MPSASYRAEGFVMTSTCLMILARDRSEPIGISSTTRVLKGAHRLIFEHLRYPRKLTFPSMSTDTEGTLSNISSAVPPVFAKSLPTLNTVLSNLK